jgi:hypothetical protein
MLEAASPQYLAVTARLGSRRDVIVSLKRDHQEAGISIMKSGI